MAGLPVLCFWKNASGQKQAPPDGFSVWQCKGTAYFSRKKRLTLVQF
jgi:hypothetical protein